MADYTPFPLVPWYERPDVSTPSRSHKMMAAGLNGSGGVASEMLSVDQIFSQLAGADIKPFADPSTKRETKTANYSATADDNGKILAFTVTGRTLTLPLASDAIDASDGYNLMVSAQVGTLTIARAGSDTILGASSITLNQGETARLFLDAAGTGWRASITPTYNTVARLDVANVFTQRQHWAKGTNIASAESITLPTNGNFFDITGTALITAISTVTQAGTSLHFRAMGAWTIQHNATSMILPRAANITVAVGDILEFLSLGSGHYVLSNISKADGYALWGGSAAIYAPSIAVTTAAVNINSGIPADARRITLSLDLGSASAMQPNIQLGSAGTLETSGYVGGVAGALGGTGNSAFSSAFLLVNNSSNPGPFVATIVLTRQDAGTNKWLISGNVSFNSGGVAMLSGSKALAGPLDRIQISSTAGTVNFNGSLGVVIERF